MLKFYIPHATKNEKIIMLLRRHWTVLFFKLFFWSLAALLPLVFYLVDPGAFFGFLNNEQIQPIFILLASIYYLYIWLFILFSFVDYYLDTWIVTNRRIINIEQMGLFSRKISEQKLFRVQDVTSEVKGIWPTFLNYGKVFVQTAAEDPHFIFKQVPNPSKIANTIIKIVEQNKRYHQMLEQEDKITT